MRDKLELSVSHALVLVFALGGVVGFAAGALAPLDLQTSQTNSNGEKITLDGVGLEEEPALGSPEADINIVEYTDYGCPWCAEWAGVDVTPRSDVDKQNVLEKIRSNYINSGEVRFVVKDYPAHPNARGAHIAANCALEQNRYWEYHDRLFERRDEWMRSGQDNPEQTFRSIAGDMGLESGRFENCMQSSSGEEASKDARTISRDFQVGTPTFFIGNSDAGYEKVSGAQPYERIRDVIEDKLSS